MLFAYADPPYPGHTKRGLYKADPKCAEVDHRTLIACLMEQYPDGWALSTGSVNLRDVLPLCPPDTRVMAWVKPFASFKPGVNPGYCWEPVLVRGGAQARPRRPHRARLREREHRAASGLRGREARAVLFVAVQRSWRAPRRQAARHLSGERRSQAHVGRAHGFARPLQPNHEARMTQPNRPYLNNNGVTQ